MTYSTVISLDTGKIWLDRNLGASQVYTSKSDSGCYGNYYQWGRDDDGHELISADTTAEQADSITPGNSTLVVVSSLEDWTITDSNGSNRQSAWADGGANDICPSGYSVPTKEEFGAETFTNMATAFSSFFKLPASGFKDFHNNDFRVQSLGSMGVYWTLTLSENVSDILLISPGGRGFLGASRSWPQSIRCIKS